MHIGAASMNRPRLRHTLGLAYIATSLAQMAEVAFVFMLYRQFETPEIGLFSWASAWFTFAYVVVDFGLEALMVRRTVFQPVTLQRMSIAVFTLRLPLLIFGACLLAILWNLQILNDQQTLFLLLLCTQIIFNIADTSQRAWLRANGRQTTANALLSGLSIIKLLVMAVCGVWLDFGLAALLLALLVMRLPYSLLHQAIGATCPALKNERDESVSILIRWQLRVGTPLVAMGLLTTMQNRLDWLLVARFVSIDALAVYSLANKAYEISQVAIGVALTTIYPILCAQNSKSLNSQVLALKIIILTGIFIGLTGIVILPTLINMLFSEKYYGIEQPLQVFMLAVGFMATAGVLYNLALSQGLEKKILLISIVSTTAQAASNLWGIPRFGVMWASSGMVLLLAITVIGLLGICHREGLITKRNAGEYAMSLIAFFILSLTIIRFNLAETTSGFFILFLAPVPISLLLFSQEELRSLPGLRKLRL